MANQDRISELYRGEGGPFSAELQRHARDRVDWMVEQAHGDVLDVGCSQGIASMLCARRGLRVLGVDNEADRIEYALADRERKPRDVRERVEFGVADASALDLPDDRFDTVLFGEVLEHLSDPAPILRELARVAKPDATIVITTPFGLHPHPDHEATFFLGSLLDALAPHVTVEAVDIVGGWFRVIARPGAMDSEAKLRTLADLQPLLERGFLEIHRELYLVKERRKRMAQRAFDLDRRLVRRKRALRRARWKLALLRGSRWWRLGATAGRLRRSPARLLTLPRDLVRALRSQPPPPKPPRPRRRLRKRRELEQSTKHAELAPGRGASVTVEIPAIELPQGPFARRDLKVATIVDHFTAMALGYEWSQLRFGPDDWRQTLERQPPELLFVESAWRGNDDRWRDVLTGDSETRVRPLRELVEWCAARDIPTVFWNKEDPPNFGRFIGAAALFDHVFTVDGNCIPRYNEILGHERVGVLPFGVQPRIHNPIAVPGGRAHDVAFAGTYFSRKHPTRLEQMATILAPSREFGLDIFSRILQGEDSRFDWPPEYAPHVVGSLPYERMLSAYKAYKVFLNINSVTDSPTMCARRVFELSACATPVLSGYSRAIEEVFGDLISVSRSAEETRASLAELLSDAEGRERRAHLAMRETFSHHTYGRRVDQVLEAAGLPHRVGEPKLSAVVPVGDAASLGHAIAQLARQQRRPLEAVLVLREDGLDPDAALARAREAGLDDVVVRRVDRSVARGGCLNAGLDAATGDLIALLDEDAAYEEHYLTDLVHARLYTEAGVIGKRAHYAESDSGSAELRFGEFEHAYVDELRQGTVLGVAEVLRRLRCDDGSEEPEVELLRRCRLEGIGVYAADRFSFLAPRPGVRATALGAPTAS